MNDKKIEQLCDEIADLPNSKEPFLPIKKRLEIAVARAQEIKGLLQSDDEWVRPIPPDPLHEVIAGLKRKAESNLDKGDNPHLYLDAVSWLERLLQSSQEGGEYGELVERLRKRQALASDRPNSYTYESHVDDNCGYAAPGYDYELDGRAADAIERLSVGTGLGGELREPDMSAVRRSLVKLEPSDRHPIIEALEAFYHHLDRFGAVGIEDDQIRSQNHCFDLYHKAKERAAHAPKEGWVKADKWPGKYGEEVLIYRENDYGVTEAMLRHFADEPESGSDDDETLVWWSYRYGWIEGDLLPTHVRALPPAPTQVGEER